MDWVLGTPTATARTYDGRAVTAEDLSLPGVPEAPPVLTLQNPPASVPKSQLVLLRATAPQVLARAARLPLLSGETVISGSLGVLGASASDTDYQQFRTELEGSSTPTPGSSRPSH
jgi:hypothetical protein